MSEDEQYMQMAIDLAAKGVGNGAGGPFGAVIVKDGKVIGQGHNCVLKNQDPTAHAEVTAIRNASAHLNNFDLSGATIYVNGLPCMMCMGAIWWSRISKIYYACLPEDAEAIGFDDAKFYRELELPFEKRETPIIHLSTMHDAAKKGYQEWLAKEERVPY